MRGSGRQGRSSLRHRRRSPLVVVSDQMMVWSAALAEEFEGWPGVSSRPMFGFTALYRGKRIFAVLPRTRAMGSPNALAFKLENAGPRILARLRRESRIRTTLLRASRWYVFEMAADRDWKDALDWLGRAYEAADQVR